MSFQDLSRAAGQDGAARSRPLVPSPAKQGATPSPSHQAQALTPTSSMRPEFVPLTRAASAVPAGMSQPTLPASDPDVARGVFQMNTAVSSFKRLVNSLGTPKDTPALRHKLHTSRQYVTQLGKGVAAKLKEASARDHAQGVSTAKKLSDAKLAKDFQAVLREFEKAQHLAAEREAAYTPTEPAPAGPAGRKPPQGYAAGGASDSSSAGDPLLRQQQRQEVLRMENELTYTEAVIEEREQGIQEIQHQIAEVNEIFRDLAVLVKEQGVMIDDIEANIENTHAQNVQANKQLMKAAKSQKETNSFVCWIMALFAVGLFIFFLVMAS